MLEIKALTRLHIGPVNLSLADGEVIAISGPSGSGKSVLLRAIADLDPNEGSLRTQSGARAGMPAPDWRRKVAYLPAESGWWADIVSEHFTAPAKADLTSLDLPDEAMGWEVARLSSGERQRLAFLRLLEHAPDVLLLDEPTAPLDADNTALFEARIKRCISAGVSVIIVTHDPAQAARIADRHYVLADGQLAEAAHV
ncbi:MAG: ATP-binding cassette domain-containing protein [Rhodobacteraceae bacterium]|nr:ATP-binding cassette domain-containing protein [Paracoccaceae bacterium]